MTTKGVALALGASAKRDWTTGSITRNLLALGWPILVSSSINTLGPTIDMIWVGRLGSSSIAGVGVSGLAVQVVNSLVIGLFSGTSAMIARFVGAKDENTANRAAQQAFVIAGCLSLFLALIGIFLSESILGWLGISGEVGAQGAAYMRILFVGTVTMSLLQVGQSVMQASGDSLTPMKIAIGLRILQVALCPALVFGLWIFPSLGVKGAALSNVVAQGVGACVALWVLFTGRTRLTVSLRRFRFDGNLIWRTVKIGFPASVTMVERTFAGLVLVSFIVPFGTLAVAAHSLVQRIDQFILMVAMGIGAPAGVLAGQNLGAGKPERAVKTTWAAMSISSGVAVLICIAVWFWGTNILSIFNSEPGLIVTGANFLRIEIVGYLVWGMVITFSQVLNGVGDTLVPMLTNISTVWGVQIPLAYFMPGLTGLGAYAVYWAIVTGIVGRALIYPVYFKSGRWKQKKV